MTRRVARAARPTPARGGAREDPAPLRLERVLAARERIRSRYYDRPDVRRALVEALLAELAA
jgi:hypothetical protein